MSNTTAGDMSAAEAAEAASNSPAITPKREIVISVSLKELIPITTEQAQDARASRNRLNRVYHDTF
jgi:hypothetical protein